LAFEKEQGEIKLR